MAEGSAIKGDVELAPPQRRRWRDAAIGSLAALVLTSCGRAPATRTGPSATASGRVYSVAWTIYAGWMPWPYAAQAGIVRKWADKYGVKIKFVQVNDYVESLNQFSAGKVDAVTAVSMDALTVPAAAGHDSTVLMIGDYSDGNDGVVLKGASDLAAIKGRSVNLVENSVSHYLLARALEHARLRMADVKTVNTSDADIVAAFAAPQTTAVVAWNPQLSEILKQPGAHEVFDSSKIPAQILDMLVIDTAALKADPNFGKALTGIWYETLGLMTRDDAQGRAARTAMAKLAGTDLASFEAQLRTTHLYADPKAARAFATSHDLVAAIDRVRKFSFAQGLFGQAAKSPDDIGIAFPGGEVLGSRANIKLRFDNTYVGLAANGRL